MKKFTGIVKCILLLLFLAAVAELSGISGIASQAKRNKIITFRDLRPENPLAPVRENSRKIPGVLHSEIPGTVPLLASSRRGVEIPLLRFCRDGNACRLDTKLLLPEKICTLERQKYAGIFPFLHFLRCSLPVRAGPVLNMI